MKRLLGFFKGIFSKDSRTALVEAFETIKPFMPAVFDVVKVAAALTPNKTDDEIVRLSLALGVPELWGDRSKEEVIRSMVAAAVKRALPGLPDVVINSTIEAAYLAVKKRATASENRQTQ